MVVISVGIFYTLDVLAAVMLAIIISSGLNPFVTILERIKIPRVLGTVFVFSVIFAAFASLLYAIMPIVILEFHTLLEEFFPYVGDLFNFDINKLSSIFQLSWEKVYQLLSLGRNGQILQVSQSVIGTAALALAVLAISFYLLVDNKGVERFLRAILPDPHESHVTEVFLRARKKMGFWLQAQILLSFFVGFCVFAGLWFLGVEHALILAILAGVFEIIPFVGPVLTGIIAVLVTFSESQTLALYVAILFIIVQQVENNVFTPLFMRRAVGLHPVSILVALLLGAKLFGFIGLILAVPVTVVIQEFVDDWAMRRAKNQRLM